MESCDVREEKLEQLDLSVPLLSTRRLCSPSSVKNMAHPTQEAPGDPSPGLARGSVPFRWEAVPGVPKEADGKSADRDEAFGPPRPPPSSWRRPRAEGGDSDRRSVPEVDSGDKGDADVDDEGGDSSGPAVMASLSGSFRVACRLDQVDVVIASESCISPSPGFILQRFLPAAEALACSFVPAAPRTPPRRAPPSRRRYRHRYPRKKIAPKTKEGILQLNFARRDRTPSYSSSKGACGITELFFLPRGLKQAFCGFKSSAQSRSSFDKGRQDDAHDSSGRHSFRAETDADGGSGEGKCARAWDTPGWGLRFLDCRGCEDVGVSVRGHGSGSGEGPRTSRATAWNMPPLSTPSEPWLAQAVRTINRTREHCT